MSGNSFGHLLTLTTWGESHGHSVGGVLDGFPAGILLNKKFIQDAMKRRRPGQNTLTSTRNELDKLEIMSGVFEEKTTGAPIAFIVKNKDVKSTDYEAVSDVYRPSHADHTYDAKYGHRDHRGGGRSSARETVARVAAGAMAKHLLENVQILAYVKQIHEIRAIINLEQLSIDSIDASLVRCPDPIASKKMEALIESTKNEGDSLGGIIECRIKNMPTGLGSPVFNKLEARLAKAMLSIPACKGFDIGKGFDSAIMMGSKHNDSIVAEDNQVRTQTNHAGGVVGGISNGMDLVFRVAFKPTATIFKEQKTINKNLEPTDLKMSGRHDPCVLPRAVPIVEAMATLVLADELLIQKTVQI